MHDVLPIRALCGSEARFRVVRALYEAPEKKHHLRGLAATANVDPSQVHKLLREFVAAGLCEEIDEQPYKKYRAAGDHRFGVALAEAFRTAAHEGAEEIDLKDAPVLKSLLWTGRERARIPAREAFKHYESHWRFVQGAEMDAKEKRLLDRLIEVYGGGLVNG
jgi:hypothetical protein